MAKFQEVSRILEENRISLLNLHKTLVDHSRLDYEIRRGAISSPGEWLKLLMSDPFFSWLRPLTILITSIDELVESDDEIEEAQILAIRAQIENLLIDRVGPENEFKPTYLDMLQRHPSVVLSHAKAKEKLANLVRYIPVKESGN